MSLAATELDFLRDVIGRRSGNVIPNNQSHLFDARLFQVAKSAGFDSASAMTAELRRNPWSRLHQAVTEAMTINETSFFRDSHPFDALKSQVIPELFDIRSRRRKLSFWSAACSSGQEPYSLAMLLRTWFPQLTGWDVQILATDISDTMVARTQLGIYSQLEVARGLPASLLKNNFERLGLNWQARPHIQNIVHAEQRNLFEDWPTAAQHDVVFLRNVLIYFDRQTKERVLNRIHASMQPDGFLFLGGGETMLHLDVPFEPFALSQAVCFRPVADQESFYGH